MSLGFGLQPRDAPAPAWATREWFNASGPLQLADLRGRVVVLHAFQMLCPGCVQHGLPQAQRIRAAFAPEDVTVVGLHTVFEHHEAMGPASLAAFLHEWRIRFPVGVDAPDPKGDAIPQTMRAYGMRGTPTMILIDAKGRLRRQVFGAQDDLLLGAELQALLMEATLNDSVRQSWVSPTLGCDDEGCAPPPPRE